MRNNTPITQQNFDFPDGVTLMSTTDLQSYIVYANKAFVEVSGYARDDILGQPHNLVRHPQRRLQTCGKLYREASRGPV
jgi:aerotaxis receptor